MMPFKIFFTGCTLCYPLWMAGEKKGVLPLEGTVGCLLAIFIPGQNVLS